MRELAVSHRSKCRHYAYHQTSRHPQCSKCGTQEAMHMVRVYYSEFMWMSCDERSELLSREILGTDPSLITRLVEPHRRYNSRETIAEMDNVIMNLDTRNKIFSDTVKWMHDTIWELMHEKREYGQSNGTALGDCEGYRDLRGCGNCWDRGPSEECMEVTTHTGRTEAAYSEAAATNISQTEETEKGYKRQLAAALGNPDLKTESKKHINLQLYMPFMQIVCYNSTYKKCFMHIFTFKAGKEWNYEP